MMRRIFYVAVVLLVAAAGAWAGGAKEGGADRSLSAAGSCASCARGLLGMKKWFGEGGRLCRE